MNSAGINSGIGRWFKAYREAYAWPLDDGRQTSEININCLCADAQTAVAEHRIDLLHSLLVEIHRWKTRNQRGLTSRYCNTLEYLGIDYFNRLLGFGPFVGT